jgi:peptidoglycan-associated lipoprotein
MKMKLWHAAALTLALGLSACGGDTAVQPTPSVDDQTGAQPSGVGIQPGVDGRALTDQERDALSQRRVYFAFDSSAIDDENRRVIEAHAAHLAANPQVRVTLEGHTDERGTREYNLALGERRAQSVERMMRVLGVSADRVRTVSYGEEKPVALDHNESAWRLNRRVEIIY